MLGVKVMRLRSRPLAGGGIDQPVLAAAAIASSDRRWRLRQIVTLALAATLLPAAVYAAYWFFAIASLEARVDAWIAARAVEGYHIRHGDPQRAGFPLQLVLRLPELHVSTADGGGSLASPLVDIVAPAHAPQRLQLLFRGEQALRRAADSPPLRIVADRLAFTPATGVAADGWLPSGTLTGEAVVAAEASGERWRLERLDLVSIGDPTLATSIETGSYQLTLTARGLGLPSAAALPLGERIEQIGFEARLLGRLAALTADALARWRDDGGTVEVPTLTITYGPLHVAGDGTLALDRAGRPIGAFSLRTGGLLAALDALADRDLLDRNIAVAAAFIFRPPANAAAGATPELTVPVSLQNARLYLGPLPIARLPQLALSPEARPEVVP
jgi:hypothetical protein